MAKSVLRMGEKFCNIDGNRRKNVNRQSFDCLPTLSLEFIPLNVFIYELFLKNLMTTLTKLSEVWIAKHVQVSEIVDADSFWKSD